VSDGEDQNDETVFLDRRDDAVGTDAVTPKVLQIARQRSAEAARVLRRGNALAQAAEDRPLRLCSELAQIARRVAIELNTPNA